jgi:hypothetical protein
LLVDYLREASDRLNQIEGYTATFRKQERINGELGSEQVLAMKVRHKPFAVYLKYLSPWSGREVVYAEGRYDNQLISHTGGLSGMLIPRLRVPPDHPLALADTRHRVTELGLAPLTDRLLRTARSDIEDSDSEVVLDRIRDERGREWPRSVLTYHRRHPGRPFARTEVVYDPETLIPVDVRNYDWPDPVQGGKPLLAEHYRYNNVDFGANLTDLDFDPANPEYAFHRF